MSEISHKLAEHLANTAAKYNATENGRSWFSDSDWDLASAVYGRLAAVQKMDKADDSFGTDHKGDAVWPYSGQR